MRYISLIVRHACATGIALSLLVACSSGSSSSSSSSSGGSSSSSGGSGTGSDFSITFSPSVISLDSSDQSGTTFVTGAASGDPGVDTVYISTGYSGEAISRVEAVVGGSTSTLIVDWNMGLWSGEYKGEITVNVCADVGCSRHLAESPYALPYVFTVKTSALRIEPLPHSAVKAFSSNELIVYTESESQVEPITLRLDVPEFYQNFIIPEGFLNDFDVVDLGDNQLLMNLSSHAPGQSSELYVFEGLTEAGYSVSSEYTVKQVVSPSGVSPDTFWVLDKELYFRVPETDFSNSTYELARRYLPYNPTSLRLIDFTVSYQQGEGWLNANEIYSFGETFAVTVDPAGLDVGTYRGEVLATIFDGQTQSVSVELDVYSGLVDQTYGYWFTRQGGAWGYQSIPIQYTQPPKDGLLYWTAEALDSWVLISPHHQGPGQTDYSLNISLDLNYIASLPNNSGEVIGTIRITDDSGTLNPAEVKVVVTKAMPEITSVSKSVVKMGEPFEVTIEGTNLEYFQDILTLYPVGAQEFAEATRYSPYEVEVLEEGKRWLVKFDAIPQAGDFELIYLTDIEAGAGLQLAFVPRPVIHVVDLEQQAPQSWQFRYVPNGRAHE